MKQKTILKKIGECPICSSKKSSLYMDTQDYFYSQEPFSITQCNECEFLYTNPVPQNMFKYYQTEKYYSHNTASGGVVSEIYSLLRWLNIKKKYTLLNKITSGKSILDVGCGTGELLGYFKNKGWATMGIEPNDKARAIAYNNNDGNIYGEDHLAELKPKSFDIITLWHVLEHVEHLNTRMEELKRLIKKGGSLVFALPNINSPDSKKYGAFWAALDVPRHLYHFNEKSFKKLLAKHGLKLVSSLPMKLDSYYVSMLSEKYMGNSLYMPAAFINGTISNIKAKKNNNYSSMIFVVRNI